MSKKIDRKKKADSVKASLENENIIVSESVESKVTAIKIEGLSKLYKLYDKPSDRMKEALGLTRKKKYKEHYALLDIDFEVHKGETVGIIGTNGSGKSTILKIITGVLNPTKGNVEIDGRISALLELGAGFNMEYTGIENVYLNGTMIGFSKEEIDSRLQAILEFADIGEFVNQPVKTYSSGMFVRLAFAVAINIDPEILIVDEALSVGDVFFQSKCYKKFEEFKKQGKTILFVTHDMGSINKYCDRVMLLHKGKKIGEGKPKQMIDLYKKILVNQYDEADDEHKVVTTTKRAGSGLWKEQFPINQSIQEYGDKDAQIIDFAIVDDQGDLTNHIDKGTDFAIRMKIIFNKPVKEPIAAFTIKDLKGVEICGTNTMYENEDIGSKEAGTTVSVTFTQGMQLQGGEYLLSLGCTGYQNGEFTVFHRLYDVCSITVLSLQDTVGYYDMDSEVKVKTVKPGVEA